MHCLDCRLAFHHTHAAGGPREYEVGVKPLRGHRVVSSTRGVIQRKHDLRHACGRHCLNESRSSADNALVLGFRTDHEAGHVLNEQNRNTLAITSIDKVRHLLRRLSVDDATEPRLLAGAALYESSLIRDHSNRNSANACVPANDLAGKAALKLIQRAIIDDQIEQGVHVIRHAMVCRQQIVNRRVRGRKVRRRSNGRTRQPRDQFAYLGDARLVVVNRVMRNPANPRVRVRTAQRFAIDDLACRAFHEIGSTESHERSPLHHQDHVGERR